MGASAKGRSSSYALSRILRTTLGYVLGGCLYPATWHCKSEWNRADGPSRDRDTPGPSRDIPIWLAELQKGNTKLFDREVGLARWSRPVGCWIRPLLLIAGDVERHPGARFGEGYAPCGELNLLGGFATATSTRMQRCVEAFNSWCSNVAHVPFEEVIGSAESANLALRGYGLDLFRQGKPRYAAGGAWSVSCSVARSVVQSGFSSGIVVGLALFCWHVDSWFWGDVAPK